MFIQSLERETNMGSFLFGQPLTQNRTCKAKFTDRMSRGPSKLQDSRITREKKYILLQRTEEQPSSKIEQYYLIGRDFEDKISQNSS